MALLEYGPPDPSDSPLVAAAKRAQQARDVAEMLGPGLVLTNLDPTTIVRSDQLEAWARERDRQQAQAAAQTRAQDLAGAIQGLRSLVPPETPAAILSRQLESRRRTLSPQLVPDPDWYANLAHIPSRETLTDLALGGLRSAFWQLVPFLGSYWGRPSTIGQE